MDGDMIIPEHGLQTSLLPIGIVAPQLPLTSQLHPHLIHTLCWKRACTRVFHQRQLSTENDHKCAELGWQCVPLAVENYGAWGPEALKAFSQVASWLAIRGNTPKSKVVAELYGRLSLLLIRANARSILVCSYWDQPNRTVIRVCSCLCVFCLLL